MSAFFFKEMLKNRRRKRRCNYPSNSAFKYLYLLMLPLIFWFFFTGFVLAQEISKKTSDAPKTGSSGSQDAPNAEKKTDDKASDDKASDDKASDDKASDDCLEVTLSSNALCKNLRNFKFKVPKNMGSWFKTFTSVRIGTAEPPSSVVNGAADVESIMLYAVVTGINSWSYTKVGCEMADSKYRWYKAHVCIDLIKHAKQECKNPDDMDILPLCPKEAEELLKTLELSSKETSNSCGPETEKSVEKFGESLKKNIEQTEKDKCTSGPTVEGSSFCGYPNEIEGCRHGCEKGKLTNELTTECVTLIKKKTTKASDKTLKAFVSELYSTGEVGNTVGFFTKGNIIIVSVAAVVILAMIITILVCIQRKSSNSRSSFAASNNGDNMYDKRKSQNPNYDIDGYGNSYSGKRISSMAGGNSRNTLSSQRIGSMRLSMPASVVPQKPRRAVMAYSPQMDDELDLQIGDYVTVWEEYEDSYAFGETSDGRQGVFPIMCLGEKVESTYGASNARETVVNPTVGRFTMFSVRSDATHMSQ